ncbi:MAG: hypothetical protein RBS68_02245 [Anaerolineales bacterium]|jgi:hypothetical protein|nr:hypothetical protein [Anaerolineales bacterium]
MFTELFNTFVFSTISAFFQSLWSDPAGRIFLITFLAYSTSYMLYSGYMSWFAGGYGSLMLSQYGFTAIDFLSLIPTAFIFLSQAFQTLAKFLIRYFLIYVFGPALILVLVSAIQGHYDIHVFPRTYWLASTGFLIWLAGAWLGISPFRANGSIPKISVAMCYLGVFLIILSTPLPTTNESTEGAQDYATSSNFLFEIAMLLSLVLVIISPFFVGKEMAATAVREKLLSQVTSFTLTQALPIPGTEPVIARKRNIIWAVPKPDFFVYNFNEQKPVYLVSSFSQTVILYAPSETTSDERGKLILIAATMICSLEISGSKLNK